jgi:hypothetical protein
VNVCRRLAHSPLAPAGGAGGRVIAAIPEAMPARPPPPAPRPWRDRVVWSGCSAAVPQLGAAGAGVCGRCRHRAVGRGLAGRGHATRPGPLVSGPAVHGGGGAARLRSLAGHDLTLSLTWYRCGERASDGRADKRSGIAPDASGTSRPRRSRPCTHLLRRHAHARSRSLPWRSPYPGDHESGVKERPARSAHCCAGVAGAPAEGTRKRGGEFAATQRPCWFRSDRIAASPAAYADAESGSASADVSAAAGSDPVGAGS